jgi:hypothetical protein
MEADAASSRTMSGVEGSAAALQVQINSQVSELSKEPLYSVVQ